MNISESNRLFLEKKLCDKNHYFISELEHSKSTFRSKYGISFYSTFKIRYLV